MSGEYNRIVSISQDELSRLRQSEQQLRATNSYLPNAIQNVQRETAENLRRSLKPITDRQEKHERQISNLGREIREQEKRTLKLLAQQRQRFEQAVNALGEDLQALSDWTAEEFDRQRQEYTDLIDAQREELEDEIRLVESRVQSLEERENRRKQLAAREIGRAERLANLLDADTPHTRFAPGRLSTCTRKIDDARRNLSIDVPQTALVDAQQAYADLLALNREVTLLECEWQSLRSKALRNAKMLQNLIEQNKQVVARDEDGKDIEGAIVDVDFWSEGRLQILHDDVQRLLVDLDDPGAPLTTQQLREIVQQRLPAMENELKDAVLQSRLSILNAEKRYAYAGILASELAGQGFSLDGNDCFYEQADDRMPVIARLDSIDGAEVVIRVIPIDNTKQINKVEILDYDHGIKTEEQLEDRHCALLEQLKSSVPIPIELGMDHCSHRSPDPKLREAARQAVRLHQARQQARQTL